MMIPITSALQSTGTADCHKSFVFSKPGKSIAGMESKKEKRAAPARFRPIMSAAVMVMPEREVPGINAMAWAQPINIMSFQVSVCSSRTRFPFASAHHNNKPNAMVVVAMTRGERSVVST